MSFNHGDTSSSDCKGQFQSPRRFELELTRQLEVHSGRRRGLRRLSRLHRFGVSEGSDGSDASVGSALRVAVAEVVGVAGLLVEGVGSPPAWAVTGAIG